MPSCVRRTPAYVSSRSLPASGATQDSRRDRSFRARSASRCRRHRAESTGPQAAHSARAQQSATWTVLGQETAAAHLLEVQLLEMADNDLVRGHRNALLWSRASGRNEQGQRRRHQRGGHHAVGCCSLSCLCGPAETERSILALRQNQQFATTGFTC
eukprot:COSAG02_NODE_184_length_30545_cov_128.634402_3_plen_157_part_00